MSFTIKASILKYGIAFCCTLIFTGIHSQPSTKFLYGAKINLGVISNPGADLSLVTIKFNPQYSFSQDRFRIGINGGGAINNGIQGLLGLDAKLRLKEYKTGDFLSFASMYLGVSHDWLTNKSRIVSANVYYEVGKWFGVSMDYGRDYKLNNNRYSLGLSYIFGPNEKDELIITE